MADVDLDVSLSDEDLRIINGDSNDDNNTNDSGSDSDDNSDDTDNDDDVDDKKKKDKKDDKEDDDEDVDSEDADDDSDSADDDDDDSDSDSDDDSEDDEDELVKVSYKDIKTKNDGQYKEFFKDFPGLKKVFFREQAYTEVFSNPSDAVEAAEAKESFDTIRGAILSGNTEAFLTDVQAVSPKGFKAFTSNFLSSLNKLDSSTFVEVTSPVFKATLDQVYKLGKSTSRENLQNAARLVYSTVFSSDDDLVSGRATEDKKDAPRDEEFDRERREFYSQKYNGVMGDVSSVIDTKLTKMIDKGLDPTDSLKPGLKRLLIRDIAQELDSVIVKDKAHLDRVNRLWKAEQSAGYNGTNKDSIVTAYLSRAKVLIPKIRSAKRKEYFDDQVADDDNTRKVAKTRKKNLPSGSESRPGSKKHNKKDDVGKSDIDILNED